jgi:hypothetical protein
MKELGTFIKSFRNLILLRIFLSHYLKELMPTKFIERSFRKVDQHQMIRPKINPTENEFLEKRFCQKQQTDLYLENRKFRI